MNKSIEEKRDALISEIVQSIFDVEKNTGVGWSSDEALSLIVEGAVNQGYALGLEQAKVLVEALQKYANGTALRVKPEKTHLYVEDIYNGNPLWHQRSMSDYDDKILAKEALKIYNERVGHE